MERRPEEAARDGFAALGFAVFGDDLLAVILLDLGWPVVERFFDGVLPEDLESDMQEKRSLKKQETRV